MDLQCYIAFTAAEIYAADHIICTPAWMACHFSTYHTGLSNLPQRLTPDSMVIVNDRTPPHKHDKQLIVEQLNRLADTLRVQCFLLDFQRKEQDETHEIAQYLSANLNRPTGISEAYGQTGSGPVFVSMPPPHGSLTQHMEKLRDRELWLELATEEELAVVDSNGCSFFSGEIMPHSDQLFYDKTLHSKYCLQLDSSSAKFHIRRDEHCIAGILEEAKKLGIKKAVGLYQQFGSSLPEMNQSLKTDG